jgi:hypothetical protein
MHDVYDVFEQSIVPLGSQGTEVLAVRGAPFDQETFLSALRDAGKPMDATISVASEKITLQTGMDVVSSASASKDSAALAAGIQAEVEARLKTAMERELSASGQ